MYIHSLFLNDASLRKVIEDYEAETREWEQLRVGQRLYEFSGHDWFEHEILEINVSERWVVTKDHSLPSKPAQKHEGMGGLHLKLGWG